MFTGVTINPMTWVNWAILREPYNWLVIWIAIAFTVMLVTIVANGGRLPIAGPDGS